MDLHCTESVVCGKLGPVLHVFVCMKGILSFFLNPFISFGEEPYIYMCKIQAVGYGRVSRCGVNLTKALAGILSCHSLIYASRFPIRTYISLYVVMSKRRSVSQACGTVVQWPLWTIHHNTGSLYYRPQYYLRVKFLEFGLVRSRASIVL